MESFPTGILGEGLFPPKETLSKLRWVAIFNDQERTPSDQAIIHSRSIENDNSPRVKKSPKIWSSESPYLIMDLVMSGLGWAELPCTVVAEKLGNGEMARLNYDFQQSDILHGVDVIWTERRSLGSGGQWLMNKLLDLDPELWNLKGAK